MKIKQKIVKIISEFWWVLLIVILVLYIVCVSILNNPKLQQVTTTALVYFNQIIPPLVAILGLVLGYPLLRKRIIDKYVTEQFEIIHKTNRIVIKECMILLEKYPSKNYSESVTSRYLSDVVSDIRKLNQLAVDANAEVYKYTYLLYTALLLFSEKIQYDTSSDSFEQYYREEISSFVNSHLEQIIKYSRSIGYIPQRRLIEKPIVASRLKNFVVDNKYFEINGNNDPFHFERASAILVTFFSANIRNLSSDSAVLFKCCYMAMPTPSPMARILYNRKIYMPLVLEGEKFWNIYTPKMVLVGFKLITSTTLEDGVSIKDFIFHYANISSFGFVEGTVKNKDSLVNFRDTYINTDLLKLPDIKEFTVKGESVILRIGEKSALKYFLLAEKKLCEKMASEISQ